MKFLVAAILALPLACGAAELPQYPFIHATGTASLDVAPDLGVVDFEIIAAGAAEESARTVAARALEVRELAESLGLDADAVQATDPRRDLRKDGVSYEVRVSVHIEVKDLSKWAALTQPLLDKPNLEGFVTGFDRSDRRQLEEQLMADAIKDARHRADVMAEGFRAKVGAVTAVSPAPLKNLSTSLGFVPVDARFGTARGPRPNKERHEFLSVAALKLVQSVDVVYRIK
ncbi:MAG: SIMPL domain-containing protein [Telluria sp.]